MNENKQTEQTSNNKYIYLFLNAILESWMGSGSPMLSEPDPKKVSGLVDAIFLRYGSG